MTEPLPLLGHLMVVDDDPMVSSSLARLLERAGHRVTALTEPEEALRTLAARDVDLVLSDIAMPTMTGLEMVRRIREQSIDVPIIFITASPQLSDTMRAMELNAFRFLAKPLDRDVLLRTVEDALRWSRLTRVSGVGPRGHEREDLEAAFQRAAQGLYMVYQPIVSAQTRETFGYEALMRSREPSLPSPPAVLDAAEKLGHLHALGRRVRKLVADEVTRLQLSHTVFVNLHPADLADPQLFEAQAPLSPLGPSVVLELTERASLEGISEIDKRLVDLRAQGFRVAVDDLGAGFAGLSYFARISPDVVKIDMSLTRDVDASPVKQRVVRSMCELAHGLDMLVVAEGIETASEFGCVAKLGVDLVQGYYIARPGPLPTGPS